MDLRSNSLVNFPYNLFPALINQPAVQRTLILSSNNISQVDLFFYTYANTSIQLRGNLFSMSSNGYHVLNNYQNRSLRNGALSASVLLPDGMRFLLNDQIAQNYDTCTSQSLNYLVDIFNRMKNSNATVEIECQCSSFYLKEYFKMMSSSRTTITSQFACSRASELSAEQFENLTETMCSSIIALSASRLCEFAKLPVMTSIAKLL